MSERGRKDGAGAGVEEELEVFEEGGGEGVELEVFGEEGGEEWAPAVGLVGSVGWAGVPSPATYVLVNNPTYK